MWWVDPCGWVGVVRLSSLDHLQIASFGATLGPEGFYLSESSSLMIFDPSNDIMSVRIASIISKNLVQNMEDTSVSMERCLHFKSSHDHAGLEPVRFACLSGAFDHVHVLTCEQAIIKKHIRSEPPLKNAFLPEARLYCSTVYERMMDGR
jgi:hypothetical protein